MDRTAVSQKGIILRVNQVTINANELPRVVNTTILLA
jgi:hypothetical protein